MSWCGQALPGFMQYAIVLALLTQFTRCHPLTSRFSELSKLSSILDGDTRACYILTVRYRVLTCLLVYTTIVCPLMSRIIQIKLINNYRYNKAVIGFIWEKGARYQTLVGYITNKAKNFCSRDLLYPVKNGSGNVRTDGQTVNGLYSVMEPPLRESPVMRLDYHDVSVITIFVFWLRYFVSFTRV